MPRKLKARVQVAKRTLPKQKTKIVQVYWFSPNRKNPLLELASEETGLLIVADHCTGLKLPSHGFLFSVPVERGRRHVEAAAQADDGIAGVVGNPASF